MKLFIRIWGIRFIFKTIMKKNSETLDDFLVDEAKISFSISHGRLFKNGPIFLGYLLLIIGLIAIGWVLQIAIDPVVYFKNPVAPILFFSVGVAFSYAGGFISFASSGVDIDSDKKLIREYSKFFRKKGTWISIEKYPFIALLKLQKNISYGGYIGPAAGGAYIPSRQDENHEHEICLLNQTHHKRITIDVSKNYNIANEKAEKLSRCLNVTLTKFNPVRISERKSRSRK